MEINSRRKCKEQIELDIPVHFLELSFNLFKPVQARCNSCKEVLNVIMLFLKLSFDLNISMSFDMLLQNVIIFVMLLYVLHICYAFKSLNSIMQHQKLFCNSAYTHSLCLNLRCIVIFWFSGCTS